MELDFVSAFDKVRILRNRPVARSRRLLSTAGEDPTPDMQVARREQIAQSLVFSALYAAPALKCIHMATVSNADIWWHLRTGEWISQHHAIPRVDLFSSFGSGKPWQAYSWLFEWIIYQLFTNIGLIGIILYSAVMVVAIAAALHHLIKRLQPDFTIAVLITLVASFSLTRLFSPRPWLFTILFFIFELDILMHARKTGRTRELLWLPVIYALWANLHIQFIDGLLVLGLALSEAILGHWWRGVRTQLKPLPLACTFVACIVATCANPYGWQIYKVAYDLAAQPGVLNSIGEMQAIPFREMPDFSMLFLALAAAGALAWRRIFSVFETGLLAFAAIVSFRSGRDMWVMVAVAAAILASGISVPSREERPLALPPFAIPIMVVTISVALYLGFLTMHVNDAELSKQLAKEMPVHAVEAVKSKGLSGPLYNTYDWGGYLIWALRMPVSIDGRAAFYGDKLIGRSFGTWGASPGWAADPELASAGIVIGPASSPLTQLLRLDPRFTLAFEDDVAAVFVPGKSKGTYDPASKQPGQATP